MSWRWEEMTASNFERAVKGARGVCVVPLGVIEKHGEHLPLGTDLMHIRAIAERAVTMEPAVVFPSYYLTQIHEAKHCPGTVAIGTDLMIALMDAVCEEIARNGLRKIVLLNGHGGNETWLGLFAMRMLERPREFTLYVARLADYWMPTLADPEWKKRMESPHDHHGGEMETSVMLAVRPDLVRMKAVRGQGGGHKRLSHLPPLLTPIWWYADAPEHYYGDATKATRDKGQFLVERLAKHVAAIIKAVREDEKAPELEKDFFSKLRHSGAAAAGEAPPGE
jgi:creatinine amidohydrolase